MGCLETKKFKVGVDFTVRGHHYVTVDAISEDDAIKKITGIKEDAVYEAIRNGSGDFDCEIDDVISPKGRE